MTLKTRQRWIYFVLAFAMYFLFRYGLGPRLGLEGLWLAIGAYVFALIFPSMYLYRLWVTAADIPATEDDPK
jgi:hypothetical protein